MVSFNNACKKFHTLFHEKTQREKQKREQQEHRRQVQEQPTYTAINEQLRMLVKCELDAFLIAHWLTWVLWCWMQTRNPKRKQRYSPKRNLGRLLIRKTLAPQNTCLPHVAWLHRITTQKKNNQVSYLMAEIVTTLCTDWKTSAAPHRPHLQAYHHHQQECTE